jgi:hypothetical protein
MVVVEQLVEGAEPVDVLATHGHEALVVAVWLRSGMRRLRKPHRRRNERASVFDEVSVAVRHRVLDVQREVPARIFVRSPGSGTSHTAASNAEKDTAISSAVRRTSSVVA